MTRRKNEVSTTTAPDEAPKYLTEIGPEGIEALPVQKSMPRLRLVQAQIKDRDIKKDFGEGAAYLSPDRVLVAKEGDTFDAVCVFRWLDWSLWRDINDPASDIEGPIVERTLDASHEIARRAKDWDKRTEPYGDGLVYRYVEGINVVLAILTGDAAGEVAVYTYSKAGHKIGVRLLGHQDRLAKNQHAPLYGAVTRFFTKETVGDKGSWYDLEWAPADPIWVPQDKLGNFAYIHAGIKKSHDAQALKVDDDT